MMIRNFLRVDKLPYRNVFNNSLRRKHLWTSDNVVISPCKDVVIPDVTVNEYMWMNLDKWSNKTALVCGITNRQYTYKQLHRQSQILGAKLRKSFQIKDGDTVAVMLPNIPEFPVTILGVLAAGGIVSTLNPVYTSHELQRLLPISDPKVIFVVNETASVVIEALAALKLKIPVISVTLNNDLKPGTVRYTELVDDENIDLSVLRDVRRTADDVACLLYSSGTTGLPKGMELTHKGIIANWIQQSTEQKLYTDTTETNQDSTLAILPMFHIYGLSIVTMHKLTVGLKVVTLPRFHPETLVDLLDKHKFDLLYLAPPLVLFLGSHPQITPKHLEQLRCVVCGAAPLPHSDIERLIARIPQRDFHFGQGYGLSETGPLVTIAPIGFNDYKSVGFAVPSVQLRVVDGDLKNLGPNETGELLIKGPNVMKGYKNNPEANKDVFLNNGWMRSGDLAKIGDNGAVYLIDRLKELIKVSGFQVPPAELESVIKEHPAVFDAAVIGIKDPKTGERPKTFIQLNKGFKPNSEDIIKFVNEKVAPYKKIKEVVFLDAIPKNPSGKILRRLLAEKYG